ncbi:MAG: hypothetical protein KBS44_01920 [Clostridiales bacterium]|nr:hypothetical protein [Candidatus Coliplasma equi]
MDIKAIVESIVAKLKADPSLLSSFTANPEKTLEDLTGIDIPDGKVGEVVNGVKAKIAGGDDKAGGIIDKVKGIFGK